MITNAVDDSGTATTTGIDWNAQGTWSWERAGKAIPGNPNGTMFNGYLDTNGNNGSTTISVTDMPFAVYDVVVFTDGAHTGSNRPMRININPGATGDNPALDVYSAEGGNWDGSFVPATDTVWPGTPNANCAIFEAITANSFDIYAEAETFRAAINGFQIVNVVTRDDDGDGLPNEWETSNGLDPDDDGSTNIENGETGDPDEDGSSNLEEFDRGTDPQDSDTDDDLLLDGVETGGGNYVSESATGTNPLNHDSDGDTLGDGVEDNGGIFVSNSMTGTNPNLADTDGDTLGDRWELNNLLNPNDDGSVDPVNGAAGDPDNDGSPNAAEQARGTAARDEDTDDDGLLDGVETNDGIFVDANATGTDPLLDDTDEDTLEDGEEVHGALPSDPNLPDTDGEGLRDADDLANGADPSLADTDGDGADDTLEVALGTDPDDPGSSPDPGAPSIGVNFVGLDDGGAGGRVDFPNVLQPTDMAGLVPSANWNNARGAASTLSDLNDSNGRPTGASIVWNGQALYSWERAREVVPANGTGTMMNGYLDTEGLDGTNTITISDIPYSAYDLIVYVDGEHTGNQRPAELSINRTRHTSVGDTRNWNGVFAQGFGIHPGEATPGANFVVFKDLTAPSAELRATASRDRAAVNGLQIIGFRSERFRITAINYNRRDGSATVTWLSQVDQGYSIAASTDLKNWTELEIGIRGTGDLVSFTEFNVPVDAPRRYYQVRER